jgi:hypothetical protein
MKNFFLVLIIIVVIIKCNKDNPVINPKENKRSFYMGFTPFPYDITSEAVLYVYNKIATDADIISHHFDDGIPWIEALAGTDFHPNVVSDWQFRLFNTPAGHKIFVSVTPINFTRNGMAAYKSEENSMPLPFPWDTISFNHPDVKTAYLNYCTRVIEFFNPDYFCFGIEVNLLMEQNPSLWNKYVELQRFIYLRLKNQFPGLALFVSYAGSQLLPGYTNANASDQTRAFNETITHSDYYGISLYPFLSAFTTDSIPADMFDKLFSLSSKPIVLSETGYPAESISIFGGTIVFEGTPEKQNNYFSRLFSAANNRGVEFIINFVLRDYDALWQAIGSPDDITKVWRDTGFYDENAETRIAHQLWMDKLKYNVNR